MTAKQIEESAEEFERRRKIMAQFPVLPAEKSILRQMNSRVHFHELISNNEIEKKGEPQDD